MTKVALYTGTIKFKGTVITEWRQLCSRAYIIVIIIIYRNNVLGFASFHRLTFRKNLSAVSEKTTVRPLPFI